VFTRIVAAVTGGRAVGFLAGGPRIPDPGPVRVGDLGRRALAGDVGSGGDPLVGSGVFLQLP
jgi:hypothetical protein